MTPSAPAPPTPAADAPLVLVGALHVDELVWPEDALVARASNPVRRTQRPGGVGANVARAAARTGALPVALVAATGDDDDARRLVASLAEAGVDCRAVAVPGRPSGRYTAVHDADGELFVGLADTGLAETLDAATVRTRLDDIDPLALVVDTNLSGGCIDDLLAADAARAVGANGRRVPRVALAVSPAKAARLATTARSIDLLFCNRREAAALGARATDAPLERHADALLAAGFARFVLSDGAAPLLVQTPAARTAVTVPPLPRARSVNGAGDALAGATLGRWLAPKRAAGEPVRVVEPLDDATLADAVRTAGLPAAAAALGLSGATKGATEAP